MTTAPTLDIKIIAGTIAHKNVYQSEGNNTQRLAVKRN